MPSSPVHLANMNIYPNRCDDIQCPKAILTNLVDLNKIKWQWLNRGTSVLTSPLDTLTIAPGLIVSYRSIKRF